jgi:hypothetical protein
MEASAELTNLWTERIRLVPEATYRRQHYKGLVHTSRVIQSANAIHMLDSTVEIDVQLWKDLDGRARANVIGECSPRRIVVVETKPRRPPHSHDAFVMDQIITGSIGLDRATVYPVTPTAPSFPSSRLCDLYNASAFCFSRWRSLVNVHRPSLRLESHVLSSMERFEEMSDIIRDLYQGKGCLILFDAGLYMEDKCPSSSSSSVGPSSSSVGPSSIARPGGSAVPPYVSTDDVLLNHQAPIFEMMDSMIILAEQARIVFRNRRHLPVRLHILSEPDTEATMSMRTPHYVYKVFINRGRVCAICSDETFARSFALEKARMFTQLLKSWVTAVNASGVPLPASSCVVRFIMFTNRDMIIPIQFSPFGGWTYTDSGLFHWHADERLMQEPDRFEFRVLVADSSC